MNKLYMTLLTSTLAISSVGCTKPEQVVPSRVATPARIVALPRDSSCEQVKLELGDYHGVVNGRDCLYSVNWLSDFGKLELEQDELVCGYGTKIEGKIVALVDYGCDNLVDFAQFEWVDKSYQRDDLTTAGKGYLDGLLESGQSLVCSKNKIKK